MASLAQAPASRWIQPNTANGSKIWGIRGGIGFSIWPNGVETGDKDDGGPRGLIRVGREVNGKFYLINFIAIEPIVDGRIEFSEISPSTVDDRWGKLFWTSDSQAADAYNPNLAKGVISHPDPAKPEVEQLTLYLFMEQFLHKANPYLKISIRSDRPDELCLEIFNKPNSAKMDRCALTATMGNYSRLRQLHLNDEVVDSRKLYNDYKGIDFIEKQSYPADKFLKTVDGSLIAIATPNESSAELASWPNTKAYADRAGWRYRVPIKLTQYWRKDAGNYDPSLELRVNGRAKYWAVASRDPNAYVDIPGGPAFENFELREKYSSGQKFYFGITTKSAEELLK
ncbi:hypothetical protein [Mucilaginibacter myungsuensis]|uniref:Uncharacterized protein n=1 Tax=Mucilaginibacter myungsuensis TaxID=649104 RepID=A0A929L2S9_9SPHI|nr:hypothetical protein [Mucilaginibacter myungsuensis]MBE9664598.1 hypothetical protein [Mucilaginibacter myungsuensis]MDN3601052.1 hypothetical protein [Mucilaginibacter myungsuensis]